MLTLRSALKDESGWSPLMIAANVQDSEEVLRILLRRDPDVNQKSTWMGLGQAIVTNGLKRTVATNANHCI